MKKEVHPRIMPGPRKQQTNKPGALKKLRVDTYQVRKVMYVVAGGELRKSKEMDLSPPFGSRFAAVRALRKIRRTHPTAKVVHQRFEFTEQEKMVRFGILAFVIRPGHQRGQESRSAFNFARWHSA